MITQHSKRLPKFFRFVSIIITIILVVSLSFEFAQASQANGFPQMHVPQFQDFISSSVYLPIIQKPPTNLPVNNVPYSSVINFNISAVTWLGYVRDTHNYADVRIGYTDTLLYVWVAVFDRYIWYDTLANLNDLMNWDTVTLHIDTGGNNGTELRSTMFNFTRQIQWYDDGLTRQIAYQGSDTGWNVATIPFTTDYNWYSMTGAPNDVLEDRGYFIRFYIPFTSLGVTKPADKTRWGFAVTVHDREDADGEITSKIYYPQDNYDTSASSNWGQLSFGLPSYNNPPISNPQIMTLREGLNGIHVTDQEVGGGTVCGNPTAYDFFGLWGDYNWGNIYYAAIQNQHNTDDWPCYSKIYITFPLGSLPSEKTISSAILSITHFGGSTPWTGDPGWPIWVHVMTTDEDWNENTITWNNAPKPTENISQVWVNNKTTYPPGEIVSWDVSRAASEAKSNGNPLRLILYTSDPHGSNGKYFFTSKVSDPSYRPYLTVTIGDPLR